MYLYITFYGYFFPGHIYSEIFTFGFAYLKVIICNKIGNKNEHYTRPRIL